MALLIAAMVAAGPKFLLIVNYRESMDDVPIATNILATIPESISIDFGMICVSSNIGRKE